eukprot:GHVO01006671.1.p1 GENE.GHVO01006671.1~~GHVO01006671.1.p1  ORF type:complete len:528 (+),score=40.45 GHVO01006671.1:1995-3578(+)
MQLNFGLCKCAYTNMRGFFFVCLHLLTFNNARLTVLYPQIFSSSSCNTEIAPFSANISRVSGTLSYFNGTCLPSSKQLEDIRKEQERNDRLMKKAMEWGGLNKFNFQVKGSPSHKPRHHPNTLIRHHERMWLLDRCDGDLSDLVALAKQNDAVAILFANASFDQNTISLSDVNGSLPIISTDSPLIYELERAAGHNRTILVALDSLPPWNCQETAPIKWCELVFSILWMLVFTVWSYLHHQSDEYPPNPLLRFMGVPPIARAFASLFSFGCLSQCPDNASQLTNYLALGWMAIGTLFETSFMTSLLLLSKGWMITREMFGRVEAAIVAILISAVYVVSSIGPIDTGVLEPINFALDACLAVEMLVSIRKNIVMLRTRLEFADAGPLLQNYASSFQRKLSTFSKLRIAVAAYFGADIMRLFIIGVVPESTWPSWVLTFQFIATRTTEFLLWVFVCVLHRDMGEIRPFEVMWTPDEPNRFTPIPLYVWERTTPYSPIDVDEGTAPIVVVNPPLKDDDLNLISLARRDES